MDIDYVDLMEYYKVLEVRVWMKKLLDFSTEVSLKIGILHIDKSMILDVLKDYIYNEN